LARERDASGCNVARRCARRAAETGERDQFADLIDRGQRVRAGLCTGLWHDDRHEASPAPIQGIGHLTLTAPVNWENLPPPLGEGPSMIRVFLDRLYLYSGYLAGL